MTRDAADLDPTFADGRQMRATCVSAGRYAASDARLARVLDALLPMRSTLQTELPRKHAARSSIGYP